MSHTTCLYVHHHLYVYNQPDKLGLVRWLKQDAEITVFATRTNGSTNLSLVKSRLPITYSSVIQSFWNFCTEHGCDTAVLCGKKAGRLTRLFWMKEISRDFNLKRAFEFAQDLLLVLTKDIVYLHQIYKKILDKKRYWFPMIISLGVVYHVYEEQATIKASAYEYHWQVTVYISPMILEIKYLCPCRFVTDIFTNNSV